MKGARHVANGSLAGPQLERPGATRMTHAVNGDLSGIANAAGQAALCSSSRTVTLSVSLSDVRGSPIQARDKHHRAHGREDGNSKDNRQVQHRTG